MTPLKKKSAPRVIVALDYPDKPSALHFINQVDPSLCRLKIGNRLFTQLGPDFVRELVQKNFSVFLDLKFHDIPNTVADACLAAASLGVWMLNVHVAGGKEMLLAARRAIDSLPSETRPLLIGVTVLTSLVETDLKALGIQESLPSLVQRFSNMAKERGLDGVVCSAQEVSLLRETVGNDFLLITPGIRFASDETADQKRVMTPDAAFAAGSDYLVMGRSITRASDPRKILRGLL